MTGDQATTINDKYKKYMDLSIRFSRIEFSIIKTIHTYIYYKILLLKSTFKTSI